MFWHPYSDTPISSRTPLWINQGSPQAVFSKLDQFLGCFAEAHWIQTILYSKYSAETFDFYCNFLYPVVCAYKSPLLKSNLWPYFKLCKHILGFYPFTNQVYKKSTVYRLPGTFQVLQNKLTTGILTHDLCHSYHLDSRDCPVAIDAVQNLYFSSGPQFCNNM